MENDMVQFECETCDELVYEDDMIVWDGNILCPKCIHNIIANLENQIVTLNNLLGEK